MLLFPLLLFVLIVGLVGVVSVAEHNGKLVGDRSSKYYLNTNDKEDLFLFFFFQNIVKQASIFSLLLFLTTSPSLIGLFCLFCIRKHLFGVNTWYFQLTKLWRCGKKKEKKIKTNNRLG